jgi:phytase-like protein
MALRRLPPLLATTLCWLGACSLETPVTQPSDAGLPLAAKAAGFPSSEIVVPQAGPLAVFNGIPVNHGGYGSALAVDDRDADVLYSLSDRGANISAFGGIAFALPGFTPQLGKFRRNGSGVTLEQLIPLRQANGMPLTGLPQPNAQANRTEKPFTLAGAALDPDPLGIDSEGLAFAKDGSFWVSDEYGPDLIHFDASGRTLERLHPGAGLPLALARRRVNRGMEGLAILPNGKVLVGIMQSPLDNPTAGGSSAGRTSRLARLVVHDTRTGTTRQYAYLLEASNLLNSEIAALTQTLLLVLERDGNFPNGAGGGAVKRVYRIDLEGATDISDPADGPGGLLINGKTLEELTKGVANPGATLLANGITPVSKTLVADILQAIPGYPHDKAEGLAVVDNWTIAISNDDDFGVGDDGAGHFVAKTLPSRNNATDFNSVYFIRLAAPLRP